MEKVLVVTSFLFLGLGVVINMTVLEDFHGLSVSNMWRSEDLSKKGTVLDHVEYVACDQFRHVESENCSEIKIEKGSITGESSLIGSLINGGTIILSLKDDK